MGPNLLQPLKVITQLGVNTVRQNLRVFAVHNVLLSVQEPRRDLELRWVLDDRHNSLQLVRVELSGPASSQIHPR